MPAAKAPFVSSATQPSDKAGTTYRRIVVKVGTTLLTDGADRLNLEAMDTLVEQMSRLRAESREAVLVSSGAVAAGHGVLGIPRAGRDVPVKQVLAAAGQGRLMHAYEQLFGRHEIPVAQALLTRRDLSDRLGYLNVRNTLLSLLELKVVPIVNENDVVAVDELAGDAFGDNDNLSALVANLVDADLLVMLGRVQGLFTADPNLGEGELIRRVDRLDERIEAVAGAPLDSRGRGGMATKLEAARLATASGVDVVIASGLEPDILPRLASGGSIGTFFPATGSKMESRKRWMLSQLSSSGGLVIDDGAARALLDDNRSLLAAGVREVPGSFDRGDIVAIQRLDRTRIAAGIASYSSAEVSRIKGFRSDRIGEVLGHRYGDEVVHRDNMVIL